MLRSRQHISQTANNYKSRSVLEPGSYNATKTDSKSLSLTQSNLHSEMEEIRSSPSRSPPLSPLASGSAAAVGSYPKQETGSRVKNSCLWFVVSLKEGFQYVKASILGSCMKLRARSEREAAEADLKAAKMQVDAADAAEEAKARLNKSE